MLNTFRNEELVKVQGKIYPVVGGRLRLAHDENKSLSIQTDVIFYNEEYAVVQASIKTEKGNFNGLGNASIKRDKILANAILELAETRAIARALRFAGYGVEYTGFEEVGHNKDPFENSSFTLSNSEHKDNKDNQHATKAQLNAIFNIAKNIQMETSELRKLIQEKTGKQFSRQLTSDDAKVIIKILKEKEQNNNSKFA